MRLEGPGVSALETLLALCFPRNRLRVMAFDLRNISPISSNDRPRISCHLVVSFRLFSEFGHQLQILPPTVIASSHADDTLEATRGLLSTRNRNNKNKAQF